jgi:hypothetical protein
MVPRRTLTLVTKSLTVQVCLYNIDQPMLIVATSSGARYFNQVGGQLCLTAEQQGVLVPLEIKPIDVLRLEAFPFAQGATGIDVSAANLIDEILQANVGTAFLRVDRQQLHASLEAWVHVVIDDVPETFNVGTEISSHRYFGSLFGAKRGVVGVMTWGNSD